VNYAKKYLNAQLQRAAWALTDEPSKARANKVERTLATNDSFWFRSPATWMRKARRGTKILE